jgi:hypothetical protein
LQRRSWDARLLDMILIATYPDITEQALCQGKTSNKPTSTALCKTDHAGMSDRPANRGRIGFINYMKRRVSYGCGGVECNVEH